MTMVDALSRISTIQATLARFDALNAASASTASAAATATTAATTTTTADGGTAATFADALASISRVASRVNTPEQNRLAGTLRKVLAARRNAQDLLDVGAYKAGTNPLVDAAVDNEAAINEFLQQRMDDQTSAPLAWDQLTRLTRQFGGL